MNRKKISPEARAQIVAESKLHGVAPTAKKHGISAQAIYRWVSRSKTKKPAKRATGSRAQPPQVTSPLAVVLDLVKDGCVDVRSAEAIIKGLPRDA